VSRTPWPVTNSGTGSQIDQFILPVAAGAVVPTDAELRQVLVHISRAGFDPNALERARGNLAGVVWQGQTLTGRTLLPPAERHYLHHVVSQQEWPTGTTLADYLASLHALILDPSSGICASRYGPSETNATWQIGVTRRSRALRGPAGDEWALVKYRVSIGHWTTAYQVPDLPGVLHEPFRRDLRWLRQPQ
jgi:hypothetical protein